MQFVRIKSNLNHIGKHEKENLKFLLGYEVVGKEIIMPSMGGHRFCTMQESGSHDMSADRSFKRKDRSLQDNQFQGW